MNPNQCSFCGRKKDEVQILISGQNGFICENCIEQAHSIVKDSVNKTSDSDSMAGSLEELKKPKEIKAFYMKLNEDGKTVAAMDCLVPGIGEIIGGSQREDDYDKLLERMKEVGLKQEDYQFYLDLRKYGSVRHAGFGLGFERCVMYLTGMGNIRDVIPFPRTVNNCEL